MKAFSALIGLAGGIGLFIYGMQLCAEGLQKLAARRLKQLIKLLTGLPIIGLLVGAVITLGLQGSSATTALVVGFVSAKMMTLSQALGVLLGSAIGTSLTVQLILFRTVELALVLMFFGAWLFLFPRRAKWKNLGQTILGCGLLFYGMSIMSNAMAPVKDFPAVAEALIGLEKYPLLEFLAGMIISALIQSSPAFLALLISLSTHHLIGANTIVPYVLGAHLGGTVTGVLSSFGVPSLDAKRAAIANFGIKLVNGLVFLPFCQPLTQLLRWSSGDPGREIANAHTFFSLVMAVGFLPFTNRVARLAERLFPEKQADLSEAKLLQPDLLEVPDLAVDQAHRQTLEMGWIVRDRMLNKVLPALRYGNESMLDQLAETEPAIDVLYQKISGYLAGLGGKRLPDELMQRTIQVLYAANDFEHVGDILMSIGQIIRKIDLDAMQLSEDGLNELEILYHRVHSNFALAIRSFETGDSATATEVIKEHPRILRLEKEYRYNHFERIQAGNPKTIATSAVHLDLIEALLRIDGHAVNIAQGVLGIV